MLSKAICRGKRSKEGGYEETEKQTKSSIKDKNEQNEQEQQEQDEDVDMGSEVEEAEEAGKGEGEETFHHQHDAWKRDAEKERDKILGYFTLSNHLVPRDIFHWIMSFIDPFPYYFMLRSVCSQWLYEFQEQVYDQVRYLNLLDDGSPKYYFRGGAGEEQSVQNLVQFKPIGALGHKFRLSQLRHRHFTRDSAEMKPIYRLLGHTFSNVTHLRLGWRCFRSTECRSMCLTTLIPLLKRLETLEILNTMTAYPNYTMERSGCLYEPYMIYLAQILPPSVQTLKFIGFDLSSVRNLSHFLLFSERGRLDRQASHILMADELTDSIECDVQHLNLEYSFMSEDAMHMFDEYKTIKEVYTSFDVSVVVQFRGPAGTISNIPSVSMSQYIEYMSKKQGVMLRHMDYFVTCDQINESAMEMFIDTVVREYEQLKPLVDLPGDKRHVVHLNSLTLPAYSDFSKVSARLKAFELLTDANRMKYPELTLNINEPCEGLHSNIPRTIFSLWTSGCSTDRLFSRIKSLIDDLKPDFAVEGTLNYIVQNFKNVQREYAWKLAQYALDKRPELISLGNLDGVIEKDTNTIPLLQLVLRECGYALVDEVKSLVESGASLTRLDKDGNNVLHVVCDDLNFDLVSYFLSVCPEGTFTATNHSNRTPLELCFESCYEDEDLIQFLEQISQLPYFTNECPLSSYKTSHGSLLHTSVAHNCFEITQWLLNNGFQPDMLNDRGESPLFHLRAESRFTTRKHSVLHFDTNHPLERILIGPHTRVDLHNIDGETIVTHAIRNNNYGLMHYLFACFASEIELHTLLKPRMKYGFNVLHYLFRALSTFVDLCSSDDTNSEGDTYPDMKKYARLCLEHYPEMLYERSEDCKDESVKDIANVSPLQVLLEATASLFLFKELGIDLRDIANKPVYASKDPNVVAPHPVMYLALEVAIDLPLFDKLMYFTGDLLQRDESQENRPNLLHITAERDTSMCQRVIKYWKRKYKSKDELSRLVNLPLENDSKDGRKARNAALLCCDAKRYDTFCLLWPYAKSCAHQFDNPVSVALQNGEHDFALSALIQFRIAPSKDELYHIIRRCLIQERCHVVHERSFMSVMTETEQTQPIPTWLELCLRVPSSVEQTDTQDIDNSGEYLSMLQLVVRAGCRSMFDWIREQKQTSELQLQSALTAIEPISGNTLLHYLALSPRAKDMNTMFLSVISPFKTGGSKRRTALVEDYNIDQLSRFLNVQNKRGQTCLHHLASNPHAQCLLKDLLALGADPLIKDSRAQTPMYLMRDNIAASNVIRSHLDGLANKTKTTTKRKAQATNDENKKDHDFVPNKRSRR